MRQMVTAARPTLLITRPQRAAERLAEAARARLGRDWPILIAPLMATEFRTPVIDLTVADGVIFTSETAVRAFARLSPARPLAWCVGPRTASQAAEAGFPVRTGPGDAKALAAMIGAQSGARKLLWPRGRDVSEDIAPMLTSAGIDVVSAEIYVQNPLPLPDEARALLSGDAPVLLPLLSPRSARLMAKACPSPHAPLWIAALSPAVAAAAAPLAAERLAIATRPDSESLLDSLAELSHQGGSG